MLRLAFALLVLVPSLPAADNTKLDQILAELEQTRAFSAVSISPDGKYVAWVVSRDDNDHALYLLDAKNSTAKPKQVRAAEALGHSGYSQIAWSPDSRQFAFLCDAGSHQDQIYLARPDQATARKISNLDGYVDGLRWTPSGDQLSFTYIEHAGGGGPLEAVPAQTGVIGSDIHNARLTVLPVAGGSARSITPADINIYEYDWAPNSKRLAAIAAPGPADNNWWTAKLYTVDAPSGSMKLLYTPPADRQLAAPHFSPDGTRIALLAGIMSDAGFDGGDIFLIPSENGSPQNLTETLKSTPTGLRWRDNDTILYTEDIEGGGGIATLHLPDHVNETLWRGSQSLHEDGNFPNLAIARDGRTSVAIRSTWEQAPEVTSGRIGDWHSVTSENSSQQPHWGKAESVVWQNEGHNVQGWLLYPENFDVSKKYPMIVSIHGGPSGMRSAGWPSVHFDMSVMAALGYFVLFPNPRGSYGEGEAFTRANIKDFGGGDLRDVLAGLDAVAQKVPIDPARLGVTGWSYGGYMTMWTVTQTNRFRAAVAGAGIANWLSYYGQNSIDQWMIPFFGASVYDDPQVYTKSSPITYIKQVKTPTLVVVGERDGECPAPQSFEFWHALKAQNVPTELVVYPGEGHSFREPKNRLDVLKRTALWFEKYLR